MTALRKEALVVLSILLVSLAPALRAQTPPTAPANPSAVIYPASAGTSPGLLGKQSSSANAPAGSPVWAGIFIAACAGAGVWLWIRRHRGGPGFLPRGDRHLVVSETRPLGNRQYLVVAAYEDRKFLLGVCPGRIEMLAPLDSGQPHRQP